LFLWFYKRLEAWFKIIVVTSLLNLIRARFGLTRQGLFTTMPSNQIRRNNNMKKYIRPIAAALCFGTVVLVAPTSSAQTKAAKLEAIAQQLSLTPQQKAKILPILADEGPKVQAIKNSNSLSSMQKIQQIKAIHRQTDPQMKAILSPEQYQKLQAIRQQAIREAVQGRV
jgi:Spy/CpxP family protein refolding chaperone